LAKRRLIRRTHRSLPWLHWRAGGFEALRLRRQRGGSVSGESGCGEAQHPISAKWVPKRERRPFRVACAEIASIGGCGGSQHPILAIDQNGKFRGWLPEQATSPPPACPSFDRMGDTATQNRRCPAMCSSSRNASSDPTSEATVCAVTEGNFAELGATACVALTHCLAVGSNDRIQRRTAHRWRGSQSIPIQDKVFLTFLDLPTSPCLLLTIEKSEAYDPEHAPGA
jgi:hypothetical protein